MKRRNTNQYIQLQFVQVHWIPAEEDTGKVLHSSSVQQVLSLSFKKILKKNVKRY